MNPKIQMAALLCNVARDFNQNNRAISPEGFCSYSHFANGGCAIGREVPKEIAEKMEIISVRGSFGESFGVPISNPDIQELFFSSRKDLAQVSPKFLFELQIFHDYGELWDDHGPNKAGQYKFREIWEKYTGYEIS